MIMLSSVNYKLFPFRVHVYYVTGAGSCHIDVTGTGLDPVDLAGTGSCMSHRSSRTPPVLSMSRHNNIQGYCIRNAGGTLTA